jgi:ABC-type transport system involved in multi-copper enzyme maturation permease subunit
MGKIISIALVTYKEGFRERIFISVLIFILILLISSGVLAELSIGNTLKVTQDIGLSGLSFLGLFIALFLGTQLLAKDLDKKTIYLVLSKPISRGQYLTGKFLGLCLLITSALIISFLVFLLALAFFKTTSTLINPPDIAWNKHILAFVVLNLKMFLITALSVFFSSFASNGLVSFFFALVVYFIGANLENVKRIMESSIGEQINPTLKGIFSVAYLALPNLSLLDLKTQVVHDLAINWSSLGLSVLYGITYIIALLFLATAIFSRRELA